jgi:hypothetical protein
MQSLILKGLGAVAALAFLFFVVNWYNGVQQNKGYQRAVGEYQAQKTKDLQGLIDKNNALQAQVQEAVLKGEARAKELDKKLTVALDVSRGLRGTIELYRTSLPQLSIEASRSLASRGLGLLERCQDEYLGMAKRAAERASYIQTLKDSWPEGN